MTTTKKKNVREQCINNVREMFYADRKWLVLHGKYNGLTFDDLFHTEFYMVSLKTITKCCIGNKTMCKLCSVSQSIGTKASTGDEGEREKERMKKKSINFSMIA